MSLGHWASVSQAMLEAGGNAFNIKVHHYIYTFNVNLDKSNNRVIVLLNCLQFYTSTMFDSCHGKLIK